MSFVACTWVTDEDTKARLDVDGDAVSWPDDCDDDDPGVGAPVSWYADVDQDGFGDPAAPTEACARPEGSVASADDCDDADPGRWPGAEEICGDAVIQDCAATEDEALARCAFIGEAEASEADAVLEGAPTGGLAGYAVAVGDLSGDGQPEIVVGAPGEGDHAGAVYVVTATTPASGRLDQLGQTLSGPTTPTGSTAAMAGYSLAGPRDLNGDGYGDLVIGAPARDSFLSSVDGVGSSCDAGAGYLVLGPVGAGSLDESDDRVIDEGDALCLGYSAIAAGDLDGDGNEDVALGAPTRVAPDIDPAVLVVSWTGDDDELRQHSRRITGATSTLAGAGLAAGDLTGDGTPDLIIGAYGGQSTVYVVNGQETRADITSLEDAATASTIEYEGGTNYGAALAVGDLNGDGAPDLAVGADRDDHYSIDGGTVYLFLGPLDGSAPAEDAEASLYCGTSNCRLGRAVALVDLDGDGADELLAGAPGGDVDSTTGGAMALLFGAADPDGGHEAGDLSVRAGLLHGETGDLMGFGVGGSTELGDQARVWVGAVGRSVDGETLSGAVLFLSGWESW